MKNQSSPENEFPLPAQFGQTLGMLTQLYSGLMARLLADHALTYPQFMLLVFLGRTRDPARITDMATKVELTQSAVTKAVQKFENLGWVDIVAGAGDRRAKLVILTPKGHAALGSIQKSFAPSFGQLLGDWTPEDLHQFAAYGQRIATRLDEMRHAPAPSELTNFDK